MSFRFELKIDKSAKELMILHKNLWSEESESLWTLVRSGEIQGNSAPFIVLSVDVQQIITPNILLFSSKIRQYFTPLTHVLVLADGSQIFFHLFY